MNMDRDHAGGNNDFVKMFPSLRVFEGESKIDGINQRVSEGNYIPFGNMRINVLETPCHTAGHVVYFIPDSPTPILFSGDTLFVGGREDINKARILF